MWRRSTSAKLESSARACSPAARTSSGRSASLTSPPAARAAPGRAGGLQLAHVARPRVLEEALARLCREALRGRALLCEEVACQRHHVFRSLAQRRDPQREDL